MQRIVQRKTFFQFLVLHGLVLFLLHLILAHQSYVGVFAKSGVFFNSLLIHASSMGDMLFSIGFFVFLYLFFKDRVDLPSLAYVILFTQIAVQLIKNGTHAGDWMLFQERLHPGFEQRAIISSYAAQVSVLTGWLFFQCHSIWWRMVFLLLLSFSLLSRSILIDAEPLSLLVGALIGFSVLFFTLIARMFIFSNKSFTVSFDHQEANRDLNNVLST